MSAGEYRDKLVVQSCVQTWNASNEPVDVWNIWCEPWGKVEAVSGSEHSLQSAQINLAEVVYAIELRADPATTLISPTMRVLWPTPGGQTVELYVAAVLPSQKRDTVKLIAQERK